MGEYTFSGFGLRKPTACVAFYGSEETALGHNILSVTETIHQ